MSQPKNANLSGDADAPAIARSARRKTTKYAALVRGMNELLASVSTAGATKAGDIAPAFRFRDNEGKSVSPHRLRHRRPLVVVFHRGEWCDYGAAGLEAIEKVLPALGALATVLVISPQAPGQNAGGQLIRLGDPHNDVAAKFGLRYAVPSRLVALYRELGIEMPGPGEDGSSTLPMSALYVVGCDGVVLYSEVHADYASQPEPANALAVLQANRCRAPTTTSP